MPVMAAVVMLETAMFLAVVKVIAPIGVPVAPLVVLVVLAGEAQDTVKPWQLVLVVLVEAIAQVQVVQAETERPLVLRDLLEIMAQAETLVAVLAVLVAERLGEL
tara:strand:- start:59 stop:373 length:315 start_codon:yes stop_codon:yes gene_type:complete